MGAFHFQIRRAARAVMRQMNGNEFSKQLNIHGQHIEDMINYFK